MSLRLVLGTTMLGLAAVAACSGSSGSNGAASDAGGTSDATAHDGAPGNPEASPSADTGIADATADTTAHDGASGDAGPASDGGSPDTGAADAPPSCTGLDPTFGTQGIVTRASPPDPDPQSPTSLVLQHDGKIVVLGSVPSGSQPNTQLIVVARYGTDGSPDPTFGNAGLVTLAPSAGALTGSSLALQPDGRILVAGYGETSGVTSPFLLRLDTVGGLDTSFGAAGYAAAPAANVSFDKILLRPSTGAILVVGSSGTTQHRFLVAQYTATGALDATFGSGGFVTTAFAGDASAFSAALQPDGKLVVGGEDTVPVDGGWIYPIELARYTTAGALDSTFGSGGTTSPPNLGASGPIAVTSLTLQSTGAIVAALYPYLGGPNSDFFVTRYTPAGQVDTTFGTNGMTQTHFADARSFPVDMSLLAGDALLLGGVVEPAKDAGVGAGSVILGLARYTAGGALDTTFGSGGTVFLPVPGENAFDQGQILQPDHKLLVAMSSAARGPDGGVGWAMNLLRYCP
jgi:uncharacterized delta-60 repeat protein